MFRFRYYFEGQIMKNSEFGTDLRARSMSGEYPSSAALKARADSEKAGSGPSHVSVSAKGERTLHNDFYSAAKTMWGSPGWIETHPAGKVIWNGPYGDKSKHEDKKRPAPNVQVGAGGEDSVKDKETNKDANVGPAMDWAEKLDAEINEYLLGGEHTKGKENPNKKAANSTHVLQEPNVRQNVAARLDYERRPSITRVRRGPEGNSELSHKLAVLGAGADLTSENPAAETKDTPVARTLFRASTKMYNLSDKQRKRHESSRVAAELAESWWCGTPALEATGRAERRNQEIKHSGKVERSQLPDTPPKGLRFKGKPRPAPEVERPAEHMDNWIGSSNTLEAVIDEVRPDHLLQAPTARSKVAKDLVKTRKMRDTWDNAEDLGGGPAPGSLGYRMSEFPQERKGPSGTYLPSQHAKAGAFYYKHAGREGTPEVPVYKNAAKKQVNLARKLQARGESIDLSGLENIIDEVTKPKPKPASKPAAKPVTKPASKPTSKPKPKSSSAKPEKTGDENHAALLKKMAMAVTNSTAKGISPKHILAAGYALHTFDDETLSTPKPKSKAKPKHENIEQIVDGFLEDTMTGNVGSIALGFAPTGEMNPHEGRPGPGKKKKKKNQFDKLTQMVSKNRYHKLTQKVAGAMPT